MLPSSHSSTPVHGQLASFLRRFDLDNDNESTGIPRSSSAPPVQQQDLDDPFLYEHFNHLNLGLDMESSLPPPPPPPPGLTSSSLSHHSSVSSSSHSSFSSSFGSPHQHQGSTSSAVSIGFPSLTSPISTSHSHSLSTSQIHYDSLADSSLSSNCYDHIDPFANSNHLSSSSLPTCTTNSNISSTGSRPHPSQVQRLLHHHLQQQQQQFHPVTPTSSSRPLSSSISLPGSGSNTPNGNPSYSLDIHPLTGVSSSSSASHLSGQSSSGISADPWQSMSPVCNQIVSSPLMPTHSIVPTSSPGSSISTASSSVASSLFMKLDSSTNSIPIRPASAIGDTSLGAHSSMSSSSSSGSFHNALGSHYSHSATQSPVSTLHGFGNTVNSTMTMDPDFRPSSPSSVLRHRLAANAKIQSADYNTSFQQGSYPQHPQQHQILSHHPTDDEEILLRQYIRHQQQQTSNGLSAPASMNNLRQIQQQQGFSQTPIIGPSSAHILDHLTGSDPVQRSNSVPPRYTTDPLEDTYPPLTRGYTNYSSGSVPMRNGSSNITMNSLDECEIYERMVSLGFRLPSGAIPTFHEFLEVVRNPNYSFQDFHTPRRNMSQGPPVSAGRSSPAPYTMSSLSMGRKPLHISSSRYNSRSVPASPQSGARDLLNRSVDDRMTISTVRDNSTRNQSVNHHNTNPSSVSPTGSIPSHSRRRSSANTIKSNNGDRDRNNGENGRMTNSATNRSVGDDRRGSNTGDSTRRNGSNRHSDDRERRSNDRRPSARDGMDSRVSNGRGDRQTNSQDHQDRITSPGNVNGGNQIRSRRSTAQNGEEKLLDRSDLLEEFRASKTKRYELADVRGHMVEFSSDQHGSRFIQQRLEVASDEDKDLVFNEVYLLALQLMTDVFGNYVIQKFFEHGSEYHRLQLATVAMKGNILTLSLQMYGCRVVQKALEYVDHDVQTAIVRELSGHVLTCVKDQNGNHVIQKAIERVSSPEDIQFILNAFHGQLFHLATHPYGCRVVQRIFEHCSGTQVEPLLVEMHRHTAALIVDQYGNYVIQHVLEHGKPEDRAKLLEQVIGQVFTLSKHKFASNVVEKCVAFGNPEEQHILVSEVVIRDATPLISMMKDQFANYVVQRMLDVVSGDLRIELLTKIRPHLSNLRRFTYGKHLISKVEKLLIQTGLGSSNTTITTTNNTLSSPILTSTSTSTTISHLPSPVSTTTPTNNTTVLIN